MSYSGDLAFLRLLCSSGADIMVQMPLASEVLRRLIPAFSLSMIRVDAQCAPQEHYSEYFDEYSHQLFASAGHVFSARSDDPAAFSSLLAAPRAYGNLIDTSVDYQNGATYQHLFQRNGIHHCLDIALRDDNGPIGILGIFRERTAPHFSRKDVDTVGALYSHLVHACLARPVPGDFDEVDSALLIATTDGRIQWASEQACVWLEASSFGQERSLLRDHRVLPEACRRLCRDWTAQRRPLRSHASTAHRAPTLTLPVAGGRLRLRAYGLSSSSADQSTHVGIQISLEMPRELRVLGALERSPLTPQQRRIAFALWRGHSPMELRATLGIGLSTLKAYQKDLYARLDVSGVTGLRELLTRQSDSVVLDLQRHQPRSN